jgi:hypothetical protein
VPACSDGAQPHGSGALRPCRSGLGGADEGAHHRVHRDELARTHLGAFVDLGGTNRPAPASIPPTGLSKADPKARYRERSAGREHRRVAPSGSDRHRRNREPAAVRVQRWHDWFRRSGRCRAAEPRHAPSVPGGGAVVAGVGVG